MKIKSFVPIMSVAYLAMAPIAFGQIIHLDPHPLVDVDGAIIAGKGCSSFDELYHYESGGARSVVEFYPSKLIVSGSSGLSSCVLRIPVTVPAGYKLKVERQVAYAYADLSNTAKAAISIRASALSPLGIQTKDLTPGYHGYVSVGTRQNDAQPGECNFTEKKGLMSLTLAASFSDSSRFARNELEIYRSVIVLKLEECF